MKRSTSLDDFIPYVLTQIKWTIENGQKWPHRSQMVKVYLIATCLHLLFGALSLVTPFNTLAPDDFSIKI